MVDSDYLAFAWIIIFLGAVAYVPWFGKWTDKHLVLAWVIFLGVLGSIYWSGLQNLK